MLSSSDLIHIPYTPDLTLAGIAYACRSLAHTYDRMGGTPADRLRRIVAGIAVELAFRRRLSSENVPYDLRGATPFTDPDRYDVALGGRRCDLKSFLIYHKERIRLIRSSPEKLLTAEALVPVDQFSSEHMHDEDLYIFAFLTALLKPDPRDPAQGQAGGHSIFLIHTFPERWARPRIWRPLGMLVMKTEFQGPVTLEAGGQREDRKFKAAKVDLPPSERVRLAGEWHAFSYLAGAVLPPGRVGIHSPVLEETYIIHPNQWANIWVYGMEIILAGYITRGEFRRRARRIPARSQVFQYTRTQTENMFVSIAELHPLSDLFIRAQNWAGQLQRD
jgi:hypothetical protein